MAAFIGTYFAGSVLGAFIAAQTVWRADVNSRTPHKAYLLRGPIHTDIMLPVTPEIRERFGFLRDSGIDTNATDLQFLIFGWGSRAFYTTAGSYRDVTLGAVAKAVFGDSSVLRVKPVHYDVALDAQEKVDLSPEAMARLQDFIAQSFQNDDLGKPQVVDGASLSGGDVFFVAKGRFNLFLTCNIWTAAALRFAGIKLGRWTPTTQSLFWSLDHFRR